MNISTAPILRVARQLKSWLDSRVVILLYHRVADPAPGSVADPHRICVTPQAFDEQVSVLRAVGPVLSLRELTEALENHRLPKRAAVVTFDDGYADNLYAARPVLEKHDVPATVFMTAGEIGRSREFWWDELAKLLLEAGRLPSQLKLRLGSHEHRWDLGESATWSDADATRHAAWDFESGLHPTARHQAYLEVYRLLWDLQDEPRRALLDELLAQAGRTPSVRATHRAMDDLEMLKLGDGGLVEIGAHTMTHPNLAAQPADVQRSEIKQSKLRIETVIGRPVESFAYPFGLHTDETVELVQAAGFSRACACMGHAVRQTSEMFRLTRADLGGSAGDQFEKKLKEAFIG